MVSVEADGHDVCTVTFSDSSEKEAQKPRDSARDSASSTPSSNESSLLDQRRNLEFYMRDAEKDGYESDVSDCDRMVIDENRDVKGEESDVMAALDVEKDAETVESKPLLSSAVELIPTRKVSRRKASVPIKQGIRDDEIESEDEGFESQKSRLSSQGSDNTTDDNTETVKDDSVLISNVEAKPTESSENKTEDSKQQQAGKDSESNKNTSKIMSEKEKVNASKFKSKICGSGVNTNEKLSPSTNELISRPPEVPESPSQRLNGNERSLVNTLVAKALKLWYDDDTPGGAVTDSPRRGYFAVSPRGKGAFELLHSPTSPMNFAKHSKETVSKALLFTADSEFNTSDAKSPSSSRPLLPQNTSTPSAMTTARLRAMLKERAEVTGISPNSVAMPIDERESASLMQFAEQVPGWIPLESLSSPEISKFTDLNRTFAMMSQTNGNNHNDQHTLNRKSYSCQMCQKTFVHSTNLMRHMRIAHGQQPRHQRRAFSQDDSQNHILFNTSTTLRTPEIVSSAMRDNRELMEKAATEAETPRRHSASDAEAAQILSSMRELVVR